MKIRDADRFNIGRRRLLAGLGAVMVGRPVSALAQAGLDGRDLALMPDSGTDQSAAVQLAVNTAAERGLPLMLPGGNYIASNIVLPSNLKLSGVPGATVLHAVGNAPILTGDGQQDIIIEDISFRGTSAAADPADLLQFRAISNLHLSRLDLQKAGSNGIYAEICQGMIVDCSLSGFGRSAIHVQNSIDMTLAHNTIRDCANGGIRVWRYENGRDGTLVTGNNISGIGSQSGNGQNGNGINIFRADDVIVAENNITDCAFSAIRANSTNNALIQGNICTHSQEVAIFSEFAFTGSIVSGNLIDEAAQGISITNFDSGGRLAVVSDNIVRNIWPSSPTNPDTSPVGIFAEADTAISGNVVENVPGFGILAGWGPYLRNVLVSNNIVRETEAGIGVSVAEGAGTARIAGNLISDAKQAAIIGMAWRDPVGTDLSTKPDQFPQVSVAGNTVS